MRRPECRQCHSRDMVERGGTVVIEGLTVVRGGRDVLVDLNLRVRSGQVTGLLGPSGSGKSTLIRSVVGAQVVSSGRVTVLGRPAGSSGLRGQVGYVTQSPSIYEDLSVFDTIAYFARMLGVPGAEVGDRTTRAIARVDLAAHAKSLCRNLSGGQRSRVSLAGALVADPALLVLDEPTVGLDPVLRRDLWALFHELAAGGTTLLVSSHVMDEASRCDALILLRNGRILAHSTLAELLDRTGTADAEAAFLALIEDPGRADVTKRRGRR